MYSYVIHRQNTIQCLTRTTNIWFYIHTRMLLVVYSEEFTTTLVSPVDHLFRHGKNGSEICKLTYITAQGLGTSEILDGLRTHSKITLLRIPCLLIDVLYRCFWSFANCNSLIYKDALSGLLLHVDDRRVIYAKI